MSTKIFSCKIEDIPVLGEFIVNSAEKDIDDFNSYSPLFTIDYLATVRSKIDVCKELVKSSVVAKELKSVTRKLYEESNNLRIKVNSLEGYLKLGSENLDIAVKDTGIKTVRANISKHNIEGLVANMQTTMVAVKRNLPALEAQGLKQTLIDEIETKVREINSLNEKQNGLISKRNRLTDTNIEKFNDLWNSLKPILNAAKAIYRGVDEVKLKDYTVTQLKKRINAKG
jgi:vacuolar-type H+-ATPase subunit D/Vma8